MTNDLSRPSRCRATLAFVGLLASLVLAGCSGSAGTDEASTADAGDDTSTRVLASSPTTTGKGPQVIGEINEGPLAPGAYSLPPIGPIQKPFATVDVPVGYSTYASFIFRDKPAVPEDSMMLGLWVITGVFEDPCRSSPEVATTTAREILDAFARQRLTTVTEPRRVELAGYLGWYIEVTNHPGHGYADCVDTELNLWEGRPEGGYWTRLPRMTNKLWILDVDGETMVLHLAVPPQAKPHQVEDMTRVLESARFEPTLP
jgi:hypothetical protein